MQSSDESRINLRQSNLSRSRQVEEPASGTGAKSGAGDRALAGSGTGVNCPFCKSGNVKKISQFGKAQLVNQYYCNDCKSVFERIRWRGTDSAQTGDKLGKTGDKLGTAGKSLGTVEDALGTAGESAQTGSGPKQGSQQ